MFRKMAADYEREQTELEGQIRVLVREIQAKVDTARDAQTWTGLIKKCPALESLDRETAYRLTDSVSVSEKVSIDGKKHQNILIQYNFVGCLD